MNEILSMVSNDKPEAALAIVCVLALLVAWKALDVVGRVVTRKKKRGDQ